MKKIKTLFLLSALSLAAACSDDTEMTTYAGRGDEAFFGDTAYSYTVSAELEDAYSIEVLRATPAGNASVSVAVAVADAAVTSAFTAPATVEFKNGEYAAPRKISFDRAKLTIGKENVVTVTLQSETDLPYATECSLTVTRDYTWKNYGKGVYTSPILSGMFGQTVSWEQPIEVAEENASLYRLPGLYHNAGTRYSVAGYNMQFTWDGGAAIAFTVPADADGCVTIPSGFSHPSYGMVSLYIDPSPEYSGYDSASRTFTFNCCGLVPYGGSLAQLTDWDDDTFVLSE